MRNKAIKKGEIMGKKSPASGNRQKLGENKTIMVPQPLEEIQDLPEILPVLQEPAQKEKKKRFRLFSFGKKEKSGKETGSGEGEEAVPYKEEEPEALKEEP